MEAVGRTGLLDQSLQLPALTRAARLTARALRTPVAQVNILSDTRFVPVAMFCDAAEDAGVWQAERQPGVSFCKHIIWSKASFQVEDASQDPLVRNSRAVRDLGIVSYLGAPIHAPAVGSAPPPVIGTVCVIDRVPRHWTDDDRLTLSDVALAVTDFIAARIRGRSDVRVADQQFERVLESVDTAVLQVDAGGVVKYANRAATELLGYDYDDLVGHNRHELIHHSHADGSRYLEADCTIARARADGEPLREANDVVWRADGTPVAVETSIAPVFDRGEVVGAVLTLVNADERRSAEAAERQARRMAEAASVAKTQLLRAMADELMMPLEQIGERSAKLERGLADAAPEQLPDVVAIRQGQARMLGIVRDFAGFANIGDDVIRGDL